MARDEEMTPIVQLELLFCAFDDFEKYNMLPFLLKSFYILWLKLYTHMSLDAWTTYMYSIFFNYKLNRPKMTGIRRLRCCPHTRERFFLF
jgi:hypothetical protein